MKKTKWILLAVGIVVILACLAVILTMCGRNDQPAQDSANQSDLDVDVTYTITVKTDDGKPTEGVGIYVYEDETMAELVWFDKTNASGQMSFTDAASTSYVAVLSNIPTGYGAEPFYPITSQTLEIVLSMGVMTDEDMATLTYKLGDKMLDFTITDTEGKEYTLSELLKTKKAVILNFWYINCDPCGMEFPYMQEAYEGYKDEIEILAMNPVDRSVEDIAAYKKEKGLTFPMAMVDELWANVMQLTGYPTTVVVDRYGNISLVHKGMIDSTDTFQQLFAYFAADEYEPKAIGALEDIITESDVGTKENPYETGSFTSFEITVKPGDTFYINLYKQVEKFYLTVDGGDFTLRYKNKEYQSEDGEVTIHITPEGAFVPVELQVTNTTNKIQTYTVRKSTPRGSYSNPYTMSLGEFTAKVSAGNDQGVYYNYWAEKDGMLTVTCLENINGVKYDFVLYNMSSYAQRTLEADGAIDEDGHAYLSVPVKKGQKVQLVVSTLPDSYNNYPGGTFKLLAELEDGEEDKYVLPLTDYTITVVDEVGQPMKNVEMTFAGKFVHVPPVEEGAETEEKPDEGEEEKPEEYPISVNQSLVTDEQGIAKTQQVSGPYTVTIRIPAGYTLETTQYQLTPENPAVTVKLSKLVKKDYTVTLKYPDGTPVKGVYVTLGSEYKVTDDTGFVSFNLTTGNYSVTITGIPEGYALPDNQSTIAFAAGETNIELTLVGVGGEENPYVVSKLPYTTKTLAAGEKIYATVTAPVYYEDVPTLVVKDKDAVITYNGKDYTANGEGVVTIPMKKADGAFTLLIGNAGAAAKSLKLEMEYPLGTKWNPETVTNLDAIVLSTAEGDEDGYYYQYVNEHAGDLTLQVKTVSPDDAAYEITMTTEKSGTVKVTETAATVYMKLGEAALIHVRALPVEVAPTEPEPSEPTEPEALEENKTLGVGDTELTLVPDVIYNLNLDLGETAEMAGTLSWTGDVEVTVNDEAVASPYDLSNIFGKAWIKATVKTQTTVVFTVTLPPEESQPQLKLGDNAVSVPADYDGVNYSFTAEEDGTYILMNAENESNAYVVDITGGSSEAIDLPYRFTLEAGNAAEFNISSSDFSADTIDLVLQKVTDEYQTLKLGDNSISMVPTANYYMLLDLGDGVYDNSGYIMTWTEGVKLTVGGKEVASGYDLGAIMGKAAIVATVEQSKDAVITVKEPAPVVLPELSMGDNPITVSGNEGAKYAFTATEAGSYTLAAAESEANAEVVMETASGAETVTLPYQFTMEANEAKTFVIFSADGSADTIDLLLTKSATKTMIATKRVRSALAAEPVLVYPALTVELTGKFVVDQNAAPEGEKIYTVAVKDSAGAGIPGVMVQYKKNGQTLEMAITNANGQTSVVLDAGVYDVELALPESAKGYYYESKGLGFALGVYDLQVNMVSRVPGDVTEDLHNNSTATLLENGATYVSIQPDVWTYYLFQVPKAGTYRVSVSDPDALVAYCATTSYVLTPNKETAKTYFELSVQEDQWENNTFVFAVTGTEDTLVNIARIGDPGFDPALQEPNNAWMDDYKPVISAVPKNPGTPKYVDIKDQTAGKYVPVFNEADGFYHMGSKTGPVIYLDLNDNAPFSLKVAVMGAEGSPAGGTAFGRYFYDDNGNFDRREEYGNCVREYVNMMKDANVEDGDRFYPLTHNLAYILQMGCAKWWENENEIYYESFQGSNMDIVWLFACCTFE